MIFSMLTIAYIRTGQIVPSTMIWHTQGRTDPDKKTQNSGLSPRRRDAVNGSMIFLC